MARPSIASLRREQILEATVKTIAENGVRDTTLDRIAETINMSRGHVRHFVGNRDELLVDAARWFFTGTDGQVKLLPDTVSTLTEAVDYLFGRYFQTSDENNAVVLALVDFSRTSPEIAQVLTDTYSEAERELARIAALELPHTPEGRREAIASTILTAALGTVFLGDFDPRDRRVELVRHSVHELVAEAGMTEKQFAEGSISEPVDEKAQTN